MLVEVVKEDLMQEQEVQEHPIPVAVEEDQEVITLVIDQEDQEDQE